MFGTIAMLAQAGAVLTLDAIPRDASCRPSADEVVVCARPDRLTTRLPFKLAGKPGTLLIEPSGPDQIYCNLGFIAGSGMKGRGPFTLARVGPVEVQGGAVEVIVSLLGRRDTQWVTFSAGRPVESADCVAGPQVLRHNVIVFRLGPSRPDAVSTRLKFFDYDNNARIYVNVPVGRERLGVRFELDHTDNVLTAPAARAIAPLLGGSVVGPTENVHIIHAVRRPVRRFDTRQPLRVGTLALDTLYARVDDYGSANAVQSISPADGEEGEIIATAKRQSPGRIKLLRVGRNALARCVSLTVDLRRDVMDLLC